MRKRLLSIFMAILICASASVFSAFAADEPVLTATYDADTGWVTVIGTGFPAGVYLVVAEKDTGMPEQAAAEAYIGGLGPILFNVGVQPVGEYTVRAQQVGVGGITKTTTYIVAAAKTVSVGTQNGTLRAGQAGTVTFPVTTANIANGSYNVSVANLPAGVSVSGQVTVANNSGTLTLAGSAATTPGTTDTLRLTIDGTTSAPFTLTISPSAAKTVSVGTQSGTLRAGQAGTVTFPVTTANIANGSYNVSVADLPAGVSVSGQVTVANNSGTLTLAGSAATTPGTTGTLRLTIDGTTSAPFTLTISPSALTYNISANPNSKTFTAAAENYGTQVAQSFVITNEGTGNLTKLSASLTNGAAFEISTALSPTALAPGQTTTVSVRPKTGLGAQTYTGTLVITGDELAADLQISLSFTVTGGNGGGGSDGGTIPV